MQKSHDDLVAQKCDSNTCHEFKFIDRIAGKSFVKLLHIERQENNHVIKEYEVSTLITLDSDKDYTTVSKIVPN